MISNKLLFNSHTHAHARTFQHVHAVNKRVIPQPQRRALPVFLLHLPPPLLLLPFKSVLKKEMKKEGKKKRKYSGLKPQSTWWWGGWGVREGSRS